MKRGMIAFVATLVPGICAGQAAAPAVPLAAGAQHMMVRAAGMPLNDGALAPGMLTVRVVQGAFTNNLRGQTVRVDVVGGKVETAVTGQDGRAQFAHVPIGSRVTASAAVNGEQLMSETFSMPSDSGVRVLLVAGAEDADGVTAAVPPRDPFPVSTEPPPTMRDVSTPVSEPSQTSTGVRAVQMVLTCATFLAFGLFMFQRGTVAGRRTGASARVATDSAPES